MEKASLKDIMRFFGEKSVKQFTGEWKELDDGDKAEIRELVSIEIFAVEPA